jgi:hypothetical protein
MDKKYDFEQEEYFYDSDLAAEEEFIAKLMAEEFFSQENEKINDESNIDFVESSFNNPDNSKIFNTESQLEENKSFFQNVENFTVNEEFIDETVANTGLENQEILSFKQNDIFDEQKQTLSDQGSSIQESESDLTTDAKSENNDDFISNSTVNVDYNEVANIVYEMVISKIRAELNGSGSIV